MFIGSNNSLGGVSEGTDHIYSLVHEQVISPDISTVEEIVLDTFPSLIVTRVTPGKQSALAPQSWELSGAAWCVPHLAL
jgi:hypothetical protein